jgi:hypothetical protein
MGGEGGAGAVPSTSSVVPTPAPTSNADCLVTAEMARSTQLPVQVQVVNNEDEAALAPVAISGLPDGGSRVAWMGQDGLVHVTELDANDQATGLEITLPAHDLQDLYADAEGGVVLVSRDATGGGTLNCGEPTNLCGTPPDPPIPCFDMYLVRFDASGETWATKLTDSSDELPPYSTSKTGDDVVFTWWYAHHGRIAFDGDHYAAYFGTALSISQDGCINIHQGDRLRLVAADGTLEDGGFGWGCSHSGYERIVYDPRSKSFVTVCKTDNDNRIAFAPDYRTIRHVDLAYSNFGDLVLDPAGGYWLITSDIREDEPAAMDGLADIHLLHAKDGMADQDLILASETGKNHRAPHLVEYGPGHLLAIWETSNRPGDLVPDDPERRTFMQLLKDDGSAQAEPIGLDLVGNRYQSFRSFADGSVAYAHQGLEPDSLEIVRVLPCASGEQTELGL